MIHKHPLKILIFPGRQYPMLDSQIEEVYSKYLIRKGHKITWIMSSYEKLEKMTISYHNGVRVYVTPTLNRKSFFGKLLNNIFTIIYYIRTVLRLVQKERFDMILVRNGIFEGLIAVYLKKRNNIPFCYQLASYFAVETIQNAKIRAVKPRWIYYLKGQIDLKICGWILQRADLILPISKWMKYDLEKKGVPSDRMVSFPMGVCDSFYAQNISTKQVKEKLRLNDSPTVIYVGTMSKVRKLDFLLEVVARVKQDIPDIKLVMVGEGKSKKDLLQLKEVCIDLGIEDNVIFTGRVPYSHIPELIASVDLGVSPIPPYNAFVISSPTKMIEYMAMGKPVVANCEIYDQKEVLKKCCGGFIVKYDQKEFADAIIKLLDDPKKAKEMGKRGREWVSQNRSYDLLAEKLEQKYYEIIKEQKMMNEYSGDT